MAPGLALLGKGTHPCATALGGAAEVVAVEQGDGLARAVRYLKDLHVFVVDGQVLALLEVQTVDTVSGIEDTIDLHAVDIEIRLHLILREVELCFLHLGRVVEAVVRL